MRSQFLESVSFLCILFKTSFDTTTVLDVKTHFCILRLFVIIKQRIYVSDPQFQFTSSVRPIVLKAPRIPLETYSIPGGNSNPNASHFLTFGTERNAIRKKGEWCNGMKLSYRILYFISGVRVTNFVHDECS